MTDPHTITTPEGWVNYLGELLFEASAASGSDDLEKMANVQEKLRRFEQLSPASADQLDNIALRIVIALDIANAMSRVKRLEKLTEEYRRMRKLVRAIASGSHDSEVST